MSSARAVTYFVSAALIHCNRFGDFIRTVIRGHG